MSLTGKKGVDISAVNGNVDVEKIKAAGYEFVMIRCGYGNDDPGQDDSQFENNVKKCEAAGLPWGAYLYSYALNTEDAKSEAQHALRLLKGKKPLLPVAFDMEDADGYKARNGMPSDKMLVNICKTFLSTVSKAGYYSALYASLSWLENQLNDKSLLDNYDVWVAQWNSKCEYKGSYGMWQYGGEVNYLESNSIPGVGVIDKDKAYKDYPSVIKAGNWNGWTSGSDNQKPQALPYVLYQVYTEEDGWLPNVKNTEDYAGLPKHRIRCVYANLSAGNVLYQAHTLGGRWLPWVKNREDYAGLYRKDIDCVRVKLEGNPSCSVQCRVAPVNQDYYPWVTDNDDYAGVYGVPIDRLQMRIIKKEK